MILPDGENIKDTYLEINHKFIIAERIETPLGKMNVKIKPTIFVYEIVDNRCKFEIEKFNIDVLGVEKLPG